ncbi:MAG: alpha/beta hydrolase [Proteobacteria bacterium]|nr:alpha/beta hydrolase [Pseudomonadota bacterium]
MSSEAAEVRRLDRPDGGSLAYRALAGVGPTVVFLGGFTSDMTGTKATALEGHCRRRGRACVRFDYFGHGASAGRFVDATLGRWVEDAVAVVDGVTRGPVVLVGSSMGGWLMVRVALARPERVVGLVGIAAAPDFTAELIEPGMDEEARRCLEERGVALMPNRYGEEPIPITREFLAEARGQFVLGGAVAVRCPVRLLHGLDDPDVPWGLSLRLAEVLESADVTLTLVKGAGHRLSEAEDLRRLFAAVDELCGATGAPPEGGTR